MAIVGVDIGGTKIATGLFGDDGALRSRRTARSDDGDIAELVIDEVRSLTTEAKADLLALGICVPGIYYSDSGTVWAPNIPGWTRYPLVERLKDAFGPGVTVRVDSDRACYVLGEEWHGCARGLRNVVFLAVGTGIGAGILIDGKVLRGVGDAAGAIGWLAMDRPYRPAYDACGCFEYHASGTGIANVARAYIAEEPEYTGALSSVTPDEINAVAVLEAEAAGDPIAVRVIGEAVEFWGMAVANLVSLFNPEMIVFGGGVFESAARHLPGIRDEARKWAQPISIEQVTIDVSALGTDAGLHGAARLAIVEEV